MCCSHVDGNHKDFRSNRRNMYTLSLDGAKPFQSSEQDVTGADAGADADTAAHFRGIPRTTPDDLLANDPPILGNHIMNSYI